MGSLQTCAHVTTAALSWHVQNFVAPTLLELQKQQYVISISYDGKMIYEIGPYFMIVTGIRSSYLI